MTTDYLTVAKTLAEQVRTDAKRLADEYSKPDPAYGSTPAEGERDRERINRIQGRVGRTLKRAEVAAAISLSQRLDDLHQLLDERLAQLVDALYVEEEPS